jgi:hypothetical protein
LYHHFLGGELKLVHEGYIKILMSYLDKIGYHGEFFFRLRTRKVGSYYNQNGSNIYRVSQEEGTKLRESVPYVKIYRYNPKHLYPKLNV